MRKLMWFIIGLIIVSIVCGITFVIEQAMKPMEIRMAEAEVKIYKEMPSDVLYGLARQQGKSVEELLEDPYDDWAPKVSLGLISLYAFSWIVYSTFLFFKFVDKQGRNQSPTR